MEMSLVPQASVVTCEAAMIETIPTDDNVDCIVIRKPRYRNRNPENVPERMSSRGRQS